MNLHEIVMKLVGPVQPVGESHADEKRLENMRTLTELTDRLLFEIDSATRFAARQEYSMKLIGQHALDFLHTVKESDISKELT